MLLKEAVYQRFIDVAQTNLLFARPVCEMCDATEIASDCTGSITAFGEIPKVGIRTGPERRIVEPVRILLGMRG